MKRNPKLLTITLLFGVGLLILSTLVPTDHGTRLIVIDESGPNPTKGDKFNLEAYNKQNSQDWDNALKIIKEKAEKK